MPIHEGLRDALPEFPQFLDAYARGIARNDGGIESADRYAGNPVGIEACLIKRLIDASLISSERAAALQDERNAFERRTIAHRMRTRVARFGHFTRRHSPKMKLRPILAALCCKSITQHARLAQLAVRNEN